jgi:hypothetical protein
MEIFETRNDLIQILQKNMIICEIGVFKGEFSQKLLLETQPKELHLIDLFEGVMPSGDKDGNNVIYADLEIEYKKLCDKYENNDIVKIHKGQSLINLNNFSDNYFDMIYIDGDHSYEGVLKDLEISFHKVKSNGYICGHDYSSHKFPQVVEAVNYFINKNNYKIKYITKDGCPSFCIINEKI